MNKRRLLMISLAILFLAMLCMLSNTLITPLPVWVIRTAGIVALAALAATVFLAVRVCAERSGH